MSELQWIAASEVVFVLKDATPHQGRIRISHPEPAPASSARCWFVLEPVEKAMAIHGNDAQGLTAALRGLTRSEPLRGAP